MSKIKSEYRVSKLGKQSGVLTKILNNSTATISSATNASSTTLASTLTTSLFNTTNTTLSTSTSSVFSLLNSTTTTRSITTSYLNTTTQPLNVTHIARLSGKVLVSTDYCEIVHRKAFCEYLSLCIFLGYLLRICVMPFVIYRIEKLKSLLRGDYNFSLTWFWLIATLTFIDLIEYVATGNDEVYTRVISYINLIILLSILYAICKYIFYYGLNKDNYRNFLISISFIVFWIALIALRNMISKNEKKNQTKNSGKTGSLFPLYMFVFAGFACVQVS